MNSVTDIWENVLRQLRGTLSETTISTWFDELSIVNIRGNTCFLHCPNDFKKGYIESLFLSNIKNSLHDIFSMDFEVKILDDDGLIEFQGGTAPQRQSDRFTSAEFTFETFVVGPSNKLAHAASMAVAEHPAQNYNPLLIYGDSGLGKTHLLNAIANVIRRNDPKAKIVYVKGDDFINEFIELIRAGRGSEFRAKYRQADLLLVDDVQFVAGKDQVQNEFFHTFNTLYESGRQIVLTSDRPPSEMTLLDDRLRTRFEWGLLADVKPPDFETRLAIVKNKAALLGMELPDKIAVYVAQNVTANVRQLEGTINKILAYKDLLGNETDEEVVTRAMKDILKDSNEYIPTPESILSYVSRYYNVDESVVRGQQRNRDAVTARQIAMYLIRSMTSLSQENIGRYFDNRDHATVAYSLTQVENEKRLGLCRGCERAENQYQFPTLIFLFPQSIAEKEKHSVKKILSAKERGKTTNFSTTCRGGAKPCKYALFSFFQHLFALRLLFLKTIIHFIFLEKQTLSASHGHLFEKAFLDYRAYTVSYLKIYAAPPPGKARRRRRFS